MNKLTARFLGKRETRVLVAGLSSGGKTTVVQRLKTGSVSDDIISTIGFNVDSIEYRKMIFSMWDVGGSETTRPLWRYYYPETQCILFVVDSMDRERIDEACEELHRMLTEYELWDALLLVYANKCDLAPACMTTKEITEKLGLYSLQNRNWYIVATSATHPNHADTNLYAGLDWLYDTLTTPAIQREKKAKDEHKKKGASEEKEGEGEEGGEGEGEGA